uniref:Uncharacterized protein n=1 Tax=Oryza barthii TaxID=65489 RepID=A0A0D3FN89_9ORYZ
MAVGIKKGHDQVAAAAAALLMVFLVAATFHFQALHARPVDTSGTLHPSSHDDNTGASPRRPAAGVYRRGARRRRDVPTMAPEAAPFVLLASDML